MSAPGPTEEARSGRTLEATGAAIDPPSTPEVSPPAVDLPDPVSPATHEVGGTYAKEDYSPAARRSQARVGQLEPQPGDVEDRAAHSGFAAAEGLEGPATTGGGH